MSSPGLVTASPPPQAASPPTRGLVPAHAGPGLLLDSSLAVLQAETQLYP